MRLSFKALTPVFIGSGDTFGRLDYYHEDRDTVALVDYASILSDLDPDTVREFGRWVRYRLGEMSWQAFLTAKKQRRVLDRMDQYTVGRLGCRSKQLASSNGEIRCFVRTGGMPFIPGSSVKGALRCAVVYKLIAGDRGLVKRLLNAVQEARSDRELSSKFSGLEGALLRGGRGRGAQDDLLKYLEVADSAPMQPQDSLYVGDVSVVGTSRSVSLVCELLMPEVELDMKIQISRHRPLAQTERGYPKAAVKAMSMNWILDACYQHAKALMLTDLHFFQLSKDSRVVRSVQALAEQNTPESPLLRVGAHRGFLSSSLAGLLLSQHEPDVYGRLRKLVDFRGRTRGPIFPKTRRLVLEPGGDTVPAGWFRLAPEGEMEVAHE